MAKDYMEPRKVRTATLSIDDLTLKSVTFTFLRLVTMPALRFGSRLQKWLKFAFLYRFLETRCGNLDQGKLYLRLNTASLQRCAVTLKGRWVLQRRKSLL